MVVRRCEVRRHFFLAMEFIALEEEPTLAGLCEQIFTRNTYLHLYRPWRVYLRATKWLLISQISPYIYRPDTCGTLAAFWLRVLTNG